MSPESPSRIRVLCVDDHALVRDGIGLIIGRQPDMQVAGEAATASEAVTAFHRLVPDITLMDLQLGTTSGADAIRAICSVAPDARIIVLTVHQGDEDIYQAMAAGAVTYLLKDTLSDDLIRVIREVHAGHRPNHPNVDAVMRRRESQRVLTSRETEVLQLVSHGLRNREIALSLKISEETVQVHVRNILAKLQVNDRTAATTMAFRRGIIHIS
jgi:DNA-binding NarL/FixJ family response regulator